MTESVRIKISGKSAQNSPFWALNFAQIEMKT